ncbi:hypothetical protein ACFWP5_16810 [Streptomyces sp. NPDC058469]
MPARTPEAVQTAGDKLFRRADVVCESTAHPLYLDTSPSARKDGRCR